MAAVVTSAEIARSFKNGMESFNTFNGNPVSCAIGLAVLDVLEADQLPQHAADVGTYFTSCLTQLATRHPAIGDVRGRGLFLGVELVTDRTTREPATRWAAQVVESMLQRGILVTTEGPHDCVLKIKPPLVFTRSDVDLFVQALDSGLSEIESAGNA
jgi:4-aminobutyrate aminotransferase-like enzyme